MTAATKTQKTVGTIHAVASHSIFDPLLSRSAVLDALGPAPGTVNSW
jgi:hypothetical protein